MHLPNKPFTQWTGADFLMVLKSLDKKTWIQVVSGGLIAAVLGYFIIYPAWFKRAGMKSLIAVTEGQIIKLQTLKRNERGWRDDKEKYLQYIHDVKQRLYLPGETALLLGKISKIAEQTGVSIVSSMPQDVASVQFPKPFDEKFKPELYDFVVEGGYHQLGQFISQIESSPKILRVENFRLSPLDDYRDRHMAKFTLSAVSLTESEAKAQKLK